MPWSERVRPIPSRRNQRMCVSSQIRGKDAPSYAVFQTARFTDASALSTDSVSFRYARIGDRVPGFGTVTDIISYAEGGRILVMQNGSVYLN